MKKTAPNSSSPQGALFFGRNRYSKQISAAKTVAAVKPAHFATISVAG
jgi:hypothetical protein